MNELILGIHWTLPTITIASFKKRGRRYQLFSSDTLTLTSSMPAEITLSLKNWLDGRVSEKTRISAVVSVPESAIFIQMLDLPKAADAELDEAVYWEISSKTAGLPQDMIIGWKKIRETNTNIELSAYVLKNDEAKRITQSFTSAGIALRAIEPSSISANRILQPNSGDWMLVDLENNESQFTIMRNGVPIFSSSLPIALAESKLHDGALEAVTRDSLITQTKKIVSYWEGKGGTVSKIVVTGNGTRFSGYAKSLQASVKTVSGLGKWRTTKNVKTPAGEESQARYPQAVGSGVRACEFSHTTDVNLLPSEDRKFIDNQVKTTKSLKILRNFAFLQFLIAIVSGVVLVMLHAVQTVAATKISEASTLATNHPAQKNIKEVSEANEMIRLVSNLMNSQRDYSTNLTSVSESVPKTVTLTKYSYSISPKVYTEIEGIGDRIAILAFYQQLVSNSGAKLVSMPYNNVAKGKDIAFKISLLW